MASLQQFKPRPKRKVFVAIMAKFRALKPMIVNPRSNAQERISEEGSGSEDDGSQNGAGLQSTGPINLHSLFKDLGMDTGVKNLVNKTFQVMQEFGVEIFQNQDELDMTIFTEQYGIMLCSLF